LLAFALSGGDFASGADFDFFFIMTPLRDAFAGFFAGTDTVFVGVADTDSVAGTDGGGLTITFAATALNDSRCEHVMEGCNACKLNLTPENFSALHHLALCARVPPVPVVP
jgi:hypothetical protein